jgi:peptidyl-prolyl cis-trans isomerase SurA
MNSTRRLRQSRPRLAFGALAAAALAAACSQTAVRDDEIWAEVNGQPLFRSEVEAEFARQAAALPEPLAPSEAAARRLRILDQLIQEEVLWQRAAQAGLLANDNEVETRFAELRASLSDEEFSRQLAAQRLTPESLKAQLRRDIAIRKLLDHALGRGDDVSDAEVADYFNQHKSQFRSVETQYRVAYILVTPFRDSEVRNLRNDDAASEAEAQRKLRTLQERLRAGDDFAELARNYSEDPLTALGGGDLGYFPESSLTATDPKLRAAVVVMEVGQIAGPIRAEKGYHLVKLLEREPAGQRELSDAHVQAAIRERLLRQKRQLLETAYTAMARNQARVVNYYARRILESNRVAP